MDTSKQTKKKKNKPKTLEMALLLIFCVWKSRVWNKTFNENYICHGN